MERIDTPSEQRLRDNRGRFMKRPEPIVTPGRNHYHHRPQHVAHVLTPLLAPTPPSPSRSSWLTGPLGRMLWSFLKAMLRCVVLLSAFAVGYVASYVQHAPPRVRPVRVTPVAEYRPVHSHNGTWLDARRFRISRNNT